MGRLSTSFSLSLSMPSFGAKRLDLSFYSGTSKSLMTPPNTSRDTTRPEKPHLAFKSLSVLASSKPRLLRTEHDASSPSLAPRPSLPNIRTTSQKASKASYTSVEVTSKEVIGKRVIFEIFWAKSYFMVTGAIWLFLVIIWERGQWGSRCISFLFLGIRFWTFFCLCSLIW